MPDDRDRAQAQPPFDLLEHQAGGRGLVRGGDRDILQQAAVRLADDQPMNDRGELFDLVQHLPHSLGERGAGPRGLLAEEVQMHGQQRQALVQVVVQLAGDPSVPRFLGLEQPPGQGPQLVLKSLSVPRPPASGSPVPPAAR